MKQTQDAIKKFQEMMNSSEELQGKITGLARDFEETHQPPSPDAGAEAVSAFRRQAYEEIIIPAAKEAGFDFSIDDLLAFEEGLADQSEGEMDMDELEAVAGGEGTGVFICGLIGIGCGNTGNPNDNCFFLGVGIGICFSEGATV